MWPVCQTERVSYPVKADSLVSLRCAVEEDVPSGFQQLQYEQCVSSTESHVLCHLCHNQVYTCY